MANEIIVDPKGNMRAIYSPTTDKLLRAAAAQGKTQVETRRASHVEPTPELSDDAVFWLCEQGYYREHDFAHFRSNETLMGPYVRAVDAADRRARMHQDKWWADMLPVDGPVLGPFDTKEIALVEEVKWLEEHYIPVCNPCRESPTGRSPTEPEPQFLKPNVAHISAIGGIPLAQIRPDLLPNSEGKDDFDYASFELKLAAVLAAPEDACVRVEFDPQYNGGDYRGVGKFVHIPERLIGVRGVPHAFQQYTGLDPRHIIHYSEDEQYFPDGVPWSEEKAEERRGTRK